MTPPDDGETTWPELQRAYLAIIVVDVVESVRLIRAYEADVIARWRGFVHAVRDKVLPKRGGRMVKNLGDGMLLVCDAAPAAVATAFVLHELIQSFNQARTVEQSLWLRIGVNIDGVVVDEIDVFGQGVDLAARLAALARPGGTVVSAPVRDEITDQIDAEIEDLGDCYLKHIDEPQRCFALAPARRADISEAPRSAGLPSAAELPPADARALLLGVAVMPFQAASGRADERSLGDLLADQVASSLSRTPQLAVIARQSCAAVADRGLGAAQIGQALGARYLVTGSVHPVGAGYEVLAQVVECRGESVVWAGDSRALLRDVLAGRDAIVDDIVAGTGRAIVDNELRRSGAAPLPSLHGHQLLVAAIGLIHRSARQDFERARLMLEALAERHNRLPQPCAWLAHWHAMYAVQGLSADPLAAGRRAIDHAHRALDADAASSLALTMRGLVRGFLMKDLVEAERDYAAALDVNPNEALAWLYVGTLRAWQGRGAEALAPAREALRLAPLGPTRYYFESLAALAALAAGQDQLALDWSASSLRANRMHTSTHRTLAIAQWRLGRPEDAAKTVAEMMCVEPGFTVDNYRRRFPGGDIAFARDNAAILVAAGAPIS